MSEQETELLVRLLKQSVLTLCRETVSFNNRLEIDGIICITVEEKTQPIVVKIHENIWKGFNKNYRDPSKAAKYPQPKKQRRSLFQVSAVERSPVDSFEGVNDVAIPYMSDVSLDELREVSVTPDRPADPQSGSRPSSVHSADEGNKLMDRKESVSPGHDSDKAKGSDNEVPSPEDDQRSDSVERDSETNQASPIHTSLNPANIHTHSSAVSHPQGLLCKRCFTIVPDVMSFDTHNLREHSLFTCRICFKGFTARNNLKRHFRLHTGVRPYKCNMCSQGFTRKDDLKAHVLRHSYNKPFRCGLCGKGYTDRSCVRNHMAKEHHTKLLHVCPQCGEGFNDTLLFSRHKKSHPEFQNFHCDGCSFIGINALDLMKHSLTHSTKSYACKPCKEQFSDPFDYSSHLKKHKSDESFTSYCCCFCSMELSSHDQFVRHEYSHAQGRVHTCHICSKQFRYPSDLKAHIATHSEPMNLVTLSPRDGSPAPTPEENSTTSSQYWCTECQIGFSSEDSLHGHIYEAHESRRVSRDQENHIETGTPMIELRKDGVKFPNDIEAMKLSHKSSEPRLDGDLEQNANPIPENVPMVDLSKTKPPQLSPFERKPCSETRPSIFPEMIARRENHDPTETVLDLNGDPMTIKREITENDDELKSLRDEFLPSVSSDYPPSGSPMDDSASHSPFDGSQSGVKEIVLERIHIRSPGFERVVTPEVLFRSQPAFQCQVCNETFTEFTNFELHSSTLHRRFVCEYCGKVFTAKPNRERHVRYHTGERPYKCELCEQTFFRGDDLKYHRTTRHSGVKPFQCSSCRMTFAWAKDLERHMRHYYIDECLGDHKCPGPCINRPGSYQCDCTITGYRPSSADHFCEDVDECSVNNGGCDDICVNRRGSYECRCEQKGLKLADDLHSCVDFDECLRYGEKLCRHGRCINLDGSFRCECENGFEPSSDETDCVDTNECFLNNGGCDDRCENQFGYFNCYCDEDGYILGEDGLSCEDIDECAINADECEDECINIPGNYMCRCREIGMVVGSDNISCTECREDEYYSTSDGQCHSCPNNSVVSSALRSRFALSPTDCGCLPGFDGDPTYSIPCLDRDECSLGEIECIHGCINFPGSAQCDCPDGYTSEADKVNCLDIDECAVASGGCNHLCFNTPGSYVCECDGDGYILLEDQHTCEDVNECENENYCSHGCENIEGSVVCLCPKGYKLHFDLRTCLDVDECSHYELPCAQICINQPASFRCDCQKGYKLSWDKRTCIDVNECMEGESICEEECVNTVGSFKCLCGKHGFATSEDGSSCADIDECLQNINNSLCEQVCVNVPGSYKCNCYAGYRKGGSSKCIPCQRGYYRSLEDVGCQRCPPYSTTSDVASTSVGDCKCRTGYHGNLAFNVPCTDINECEMDNFGCSDDCVNTEGSAYCLCPDGFILQSDRKTCGDIDECARPSDNDCEQNCVNTIGSYKCGCDLRYFTVGSNENTCLDINECDTNNFGCTHTCVNTVGGAHCACPTGYQVTEDGKGCEDKDECETDNGGCDDECINSLGSYSCDCSKAGFEKYHYNEKKCVDINECIQFAPCDDICSNTYGSFKCRCRGPGLRLAEDGLKCLDIDECASNKICHHKCVNLRGSYRCECNPGYYSDGTRCKECPLGTYNSKSSNKRSCSHCPAKSMTRQKGSSSISQCVCAPGFSGNPAKGISCSDINECKKDNGGCDHRCINSAGSFSCSCRTSYVLQEDKKSCNVVACPTLKPLPHGSIWPPACTSIASRRKLKKGTTCTFRCGRGYDLFGHRFRVCQSNSSWTGSVPTCEAKYCDGLEAPLHGKVLPPICLSDFVAFRQRCTFSCDEGYIMIGKPSTKCKANQSWSGRKVPKCVPENTLPRRENDV